MPEDLTRLVATVARKDGHAVVAVRGEIDMATADLFQAALREAAVGSRSVEVDLHETTFMDSTGLSVLIAAQQRLGEAAQPIVVRNPGPTVRKVLEVSGMATVLDVRVDTPGPRAEPNEPAQTSSPRGASSGQM